MSPTNRLHACPTLQQTQDATPAGEFPFWKVLAAGGAAGLAGSVISCPSEHVSAVLGCWAAQRVQCWAGVCA